ncbi:MAG: flagellar motor switch protein FliG [Spirochaetales bacterium]|nr:flagellar motor switch protein FliG [Spirochaetales bacterium]MDY5914946.1 flagellar motor switch protein FliG [Treponema sp.]
MADETEVPKSNPKPVPKPGQLKPAGSSGKKNNSKDYKSLTGRQKAAIFLISLGPDVSAEIMKHLREDEVETLTFEIARQEKVNPDFKDSVLEEFQELMNAQNFITTGGIDYARELLEKSLGSQKAIDIINRLTSSLQVRPFDFIRRTDPAHLLNFIQQEYPQTIALILAYLEPGKAAVILQNLPEDMQAEVSKRLATMDRTSPDVLREVERVLEKKLSTLSSEDYTAAGGVEAIVEILNQVDRSSEKAIIESLEEDDPDLAEEIKKRMFVFEDIVQLDDRAIQKVLRDVDQPELAKALKSVDSDVQDKIFRNMSKRAAAMLKDDMEFMGPVRLKDVEESQQKIVSMIRHLEEIGEIVIARSGEDELVS